MTARRLRTECLAIALLAVVVTVPFSDVLFTDARFYVRDLTRYYYPTKKILREIVQGGEFPYWNRYYGAGQPIASNPEYEVFYPLQWLILLPDYDLGYRLHILVHVYIAAFGMYVLLRALRMRVFAALFGAIAFASGGLFVSYVNLLPILFAFVWIPWIGWLLMRAVERPSAARIAAAGMIVGLQALVGEPTTLVQTWGLSLPIAGWLGWRNGRWRGAGAGIAIAVLVLVIGISIGAVQLVPAAEHVGDSARSRAFSLGLATRWSMHPARPLELFAPNLFGHLFGERTYWGAGMYRDTSSPFLYSIYVGLPMAVFAIAAFAGRVRGRVVGLAVIVASTILALGEHTPVFGLLHDVGVAGSVRYPEKFLLPALICLVIMGSAGFDRFLRRDPVASRVSLRTGAAVAVVSGIMLLLHITPLSDDLFRSLWGITDQARLTVLLPIVRQDWVVSVVRASALCGILWAAFRVKGRTWRLLVLCGVLIDLVPVGVGVLPRIDRSFFDEPPVAADLEPGRETYRIFHEVDWYGSGKVARSYFATGGRAYQVIRNGMYPMTPALWGFSLALDRDYDKTALLPTVDFVGAMWQVRDAGQKRWREIFAAMSNVRYVSRYRPFDEEMARVGADTAAIRPVDFVELEPWPRYYFAEEIVRLESREAFASRLTLETFNPKVAFVESESFEPGRGVVLSVEETANTARLVVELEAPGLLVASVTRHRYWSATVDGASAGLEAVNVAYQGVRIGPGRHEVVMSYRNPKVVPLAVFSLLVLAGSLVLIVASLLRAPSRTISA